VRRTTGRLARVSQSSFLLLENDTQSTMLRNWRLANPEILIALLPKVKAEGGVLTLLWVVVALLGLMVICLCVTVYHIVLHHGRVLLRLDEMERGCVDARGRLVPSSPPSVAPQTWPEASGSDRQKEPTAHDGAIKVKGLGTERPLSESQIEREGRRAGNRAPSFNLPDLDGRTVSLDQYRGRRVLLVFSDPKCGPCETLLPELVRFECEQNDGAIALIMVGRGEAEMNRRKAQDYGVNFPVVLQRHWELSAEYGIFATPAAFLIGPDGVIERNVATGVNDILSLARLPGNGGRGDEQSIR
jgi:peroxiredoxin